MADDILRVAVAIPEYIVEHELGRGGMGVVFVGRHRRLDRAVAIKELPSALAADADVRERFSTEARTLASLSHPHIVPIFDYVEREGLCLIVMEQLPGGTLWDRFTNTGVTTPAACAYVMACCSALQHAHDRRVLHLDVKPDNLMFDAEGVLKVTDFGISSVIGGGRTLGTVDGTVMGTPAYMAPEQARGGELTPATDLYASSVMLYELLTGQLPWTGADTAAELLHQRLEQEPIPIRDVAPRIPEPVATVVMRGLEREPDRRFAHAEDLGVALGEAAAIAWGADWLDSADVPVLGSRSIAIAARTEAPVGSPERADSVMSGTGAAAPSLSVVRAAGGLRLAGLDLNRLAGSDLVDVEDLVHPPPPPRRATIATAALSLLVLVVALVGLGSPHRSGSFAPGEVTLAGQDVARVDRVGADLRHVVPVIVSGRLAEGTDQVILRVSTLGVPLGSAEADVVDGRALIDPGQMRLIPAGKLNAEIELRGKGETVARGEFGFRVTNPWFLTAMGLTAVLLLLISFANLETSLKPLLRGRPHRRSRFTASVWGATIGAGFVLLSAALGIAQMTIASVIVCALLGAAAGYVSCDVAAGIGRRRKLRRALRRAERTMRERVAA
jgi:serine/threonine-protein kinase